MASSRRRRGVGNASSQSRPTGRCTSRCRPPTPTSANPSSHDALVRTLAALRVGELVLVEQVRYRDVFGWFLDELERAGFALAGRVDDVGERVCCMRFLSDA